MSMRSAASTSGVSLDDIATYTDDGRAEFFADRHSNLEIVWAAVEKDLPQLSQAIRDLLESV